MKKVFLDTNILIDFVDVREKYVYAKGILELGDRGHIELYASYLTYANMAYILRHRTQQEKYTLLREARKGITAIAPTIAQLDYALTHEVNDFEDLLQYQCALAAGCDVIVTNNLKDYEEFSSIPCATSMEFLIDFFSTAE